MRSSPGETGRDLAHQPRSDRRQLSPEVAAVRHRLAARTKPLLAYGHRGSDDEQGFRRAFPRPAHPRRYEGIDRARSAAGGRQDAAREAARYSERKNTRDGSDEAAGGLCSVMSTP